MQTCPYCEDGTVTDIPIKSNADISKVLALIAQGDNKKEIVFSHKGTAYGIEINFCPICGRDLTSNPKTIPDKINSTEDLMRIADELSARCSRVRSHPPYVFVIKDNIPFINIEPIHYLSHRKPEQLQALSDKPFYSIASPYDITITTDKGEYSISEYNVRWFFTEERAKQYIADHNLTWR